MEKEFRMGEIEITVTNNEPTAKNILIVVSNRLPFVLTRDPKTKVLSRKARLVLHFGLNLGLLGSSNSRRSSFHKIALIYKIYIALQSIFEKSRTLLRTLPL